MPYIGVSPQFGVRRKHTYTATAGQTSFSGAGSEGATLSYTDSNFVDVYQNGVKLGDADYTSTSGTAIVLAQGASVDDLVEIIVFDAFSAADTVSKADGGQFDGNVTMAGTLGVTGATTLSSTLGVTGASTLTGALSAKGGAVFNEDSADVDFRVESNGETHTLFVQAGSDCVGIKTTSPNDYYADDFVVTAPDEGGMTIVNSTTHRGYLAFADGTSGDARYRGYISYDHNTDFLYLGAGGSGYLHIDGSGRVVAPNQPHFQARSNAGNNGNTWETGQVIKFQTVAVNQGSHYSTSTGRFTAPVSGFYQFNFVGFGYNGGSVGTQTVSVNLLINGSGYIMIAYENNSNGAGNTYPAVSASSAVYLSANDHASIYVQGSGIYADSSNLYTAFSGFLVA